MDSYYKKRSQYQDISGSTQISALQNGTITLAVPPGDAVHLLFYTIFIQKVYGSITTLLAAQSWKLQDSADAPVPIYVIPTDTITDTGAGVIQGLAATFSADFGSIGSALTVGKSLQLVISSGGAAGTVSWEGYAKRTVVGIP